MSFSSFLCSHLTRIVVVFGVGGSLVGCSSFGVSESPPAPDSGLPPLDPADAGEKDSGIDGGDQCPVLFQDNFDASETFNTAWSIRGSGGIEIVKEGFSGPQALGVDVHQSGPNGYLELDLGSHSRIVATVRVDVIQKGSGEVDLFNLVPEGASSRPLALVHSQSLSKFAFQLPNSGGSGDQTVPVTLEVGRWHLIKIDLDIRRKEVRCEVDGAPVDARLLPTEWAPGALTLKVGTVYTKEVMASFRLRFDDVEVRACD